MNSSNFSGDQLPGLPLPEDAENHDGLRTFLAYFVQVLCSCTRISFDNKGKGKFNWKIHCVDTLRIGISARFGWKFTRHLRRSPLQQNANSYQFVHFELGHCWRMFSHWYPLYYDDDGTWLLAIWQRHVQGITSKPINLRRRTNNRKYWNEISKVYMTTTSVNQFTSSLLLTVMSADRYIAVCHPISSSKFRTPLIAKVS